MNTFNKVRDRNGKSIGRPRPSRRAVNEKQVGRPSVAGQLKADWEGELRRACLFLSPHAGFRGELIWKRKQKQAENQIPVEARLFFFLFSWEVWDPLAEDRCLLAALVGQPSSA